MMEFSSPNGSVKILFTLNENGELFYTVSKGNSTIVDISPLGLMTNLGNFKSGLKYPETTDKKEINETYRVVSCKKATYTNHCLERIISFEKDGIILNITVRAYDDGIAFRYSIDGGAPDISISVENTGFNVPAESKIWSMPYGSGPFCYEGDFAESTIETLEGGQTMPLLYRTPDGLYSLISEAQLDGQYVGSQLIPSGSTLITAFPPQHGTGPINSHMPFATPWRAIVTGTLADITETTMFENLCPDPDPSIDYSFAEPGAASWTWLVGAKDIQRDPVKIKQYIDFAEEMGWKYFIMDEGWQPDAPGGSGISYSGYFDWFPDIVSYANGKKIKLIAWVRADDLNTQLKRDQRLPDWKAHGIAGIKVDFFDRETQDRTKLFTDVYIQCAQLGMVVNAHGSNKSTGETRTYPNVLTREGIKGQEYQTLSPLQYTIIPYTRCADGPADVTEKVFPMSAACTAGFQAAISILIQSGIHCFASSIEDYRKSHTYSLHKDLPAVWDDTKFIDGEPGQFATLVRRSGDDWYGASATVPARDAIFPLNFLGSGEYHAVIYKDAGYTNNDLAVDTLKVTCKDTLTIPMKMNGGCGVKICRKMPVL